MSLFCMPGKCKEKVFDVDVSTNSDSKPEILEMPFSFDELKSIVKRGIIPVLKCRHIFAPSDKIYVDNISYLKLSQFTYSIMNGMEVYAAIFACPMATSLPYYVMFASDGTIQTVLDKNNSFS